MRDMAPPCLTCVHGLLQPVCRRDAAGEELDAEPESPRRAAPAGVLEATGQVLPLVCHRGVVTCMTE